MPGFIRNTGGAMWHVKNILVAEDFSPSSEAALVRALELAGRTGAALHVLHVQVLYDDALGSPAGPAEHEQRIRARLRERLEAVAGQAGLDPGTVPPVTFALRRAVSPAPEILDYVAGHGVEVVVMGTHGRRGLKHLLLGSVAQEVVRLSPVPVLTVRPGTVEGPVRSILAPVDFSRHAQEALRYARTLADLYGAYLDVLHVIEEPVYPAFYHAGVFSVYDAEPEIEGQAYRHLKQFYARTCGVDRGVTFHVRTGHAATEIARFAGERGSDLIVLATHGLTGLAHLLLGSVAERVVRLAPCPVFTVKSFGGAQSRETQATRAVASGRRMAGNPTA